MDKTIRLDACVPCITNLGSHALQEKKKEKKGNQNDINLAEK